MNRYIGVKQINAKAMDRKEYNELRGWTVPADENPDDSGYLVEYVDGGQANHPDFSGYISWSPKDVFERAYRQTEGLTFGLVLEAMKQGAKAARAGWNGKGMYVYLVPGKEQAAEFNAPPSWFNPYMIIKNVDKSLSTWVPSVNDCLAEDWTVLE